ncbi:uncharacterized protein LAJ45_02225 [Morchella importuna]|uniref:uncharacterized protein n=1 Tax=Morchella importuna TaxID=1174673 RepID=UPI001E8EE5D3|nr:uncharacterized protein LAJ45_02225 [Morchella importuna]KAH8153413.1 hypothetical protein LAJ45_02225 [Morchella importuna]
MVEREQKNWGEGMADREMDAWEAEHRRQQALSNSPEDQYNQHITNHSNSPNMSPTCTSGTNTRTNADANGAANADNGFVGSTNNFSVPPSIPKSFQQAQAPSQQSARPQVPFRAKPNPPSHKPARPSVRSISPPLKEAPIKEGQEEQTYKAWKSIPLFRQSGSSSSSGSSASSPAVREPTLPPLPRHAKAKWQGGARIGE